MIISYLIPIASKKRKVEINYFRSWVQWIVIAAVIVQKKLKKGKLHISPSKDSYMNNALVYKFDNKMSRLWLYQINILREKVTKIRLYEKTFVRRSSCTNLETKVRQKSDKSDESSYVWQKSCHMNIYV